MGTTVRQKTRGKCGAGARGAVGLSTLARGLEILGLFLDTRSRWDTLLIAKQLGLTKSMTYKYIQTLECAGYLVRELDGSTLRLGPRVLELAHSARNPSLVADLAYPVLEEVVARTNETALLATRMGNRAVCLAKVESRHSLKLSYRLGDTYPLHAGATAEVLLAWLDDKLLDRVLSSLEFERFTDKTIESSDRLRKRLTSIRRNGFAVSEGELDAGIFTFAAPVFDQNLNVVASLSIGGPLQRLDSATRSQYADLVQQAANRVTGLLARGV